MNLELSCFLVSFNFQVNMACSVWENFLWNSKSPTFLLFIRALDTNLPRSDRTVQKNPIVKTSSSNLVLGVWHIKYGKALQCAV